MDAVNYLTQSFAKWVVVVLAIVFIVAPLSSTFTPQRAEAGGAVVVVGGNGTIQETISAAANSLISNIQASLLLKEWTLDGIAFALAKMALQKMTASIVDWINTGFDGSPTFLTDMRGFLLDIGDQVAGNFIDDIGLGFFCSPFELDIRAALEVQYQQVRNYDSTAGGGNALQCTLTDVVDNIDGFFQGNIVNNGGWDGWFNLTAKPGNNPYGAFALATFEMEVALRNAKGEELGLTSFGQGFLSVKQCNDVVGGGQKCTVTTPGKILEEQLTVNLDSGRQALLEADEINEIISALFGQLVTKIFDSAGGLLGASQSSTGGTSLTDAMVGDTSTIGLSVNNDTLDEAIANENTYLEVANRIIATIDEAEAYGQSACTSSPAFPGSLDAQRSTIDAEAGNAVLLLVQLEDIQNRAASTDPEISAAAYDDYTELLATGLLHSAIDVHVLEAQTEAQIEYDATQYKNQVDIACSSN